MDLSLSGHGQALRDDLLDFMDSSVYPAEERYRDEIESSGDRHLNPPVMEELKAEARTRDL